MLQCRRVLPALALALALSLAACSPAPAGESPSLPPETPGAASPSAQPEAETSTLRGTLNTVDTGQDLLVLVDGDGGYCRFDLNGVDAAGLEPGDTVEVTYTGVLSPDSDDLTAVVTALEKAE